MKKQSNERQFTKAYQLISEDIIVEYDNSAGEDHKYWKHKWSKLKIENSLKKAELGYLGKMSFLKKYLPAKGKILEAGCGKGNIVLALNKLGYNTTGIDYAKETVKKVKQLYPSLPIEYGNLLELNYPDKCFDVYLSLGVIEHYEEKENVIKIFEEAKRVTKSMFFFSVPFFSPALKMNYKKGLLNKNIESQKFFQKYFTKKAFYGMLSEFDLIPFDYVLYATYVGLQRYNNLFKTLWNQNKIFRFAYKKSGRLLDFALGKKYAHMIGAWCTIKNKN